MIRRGDGKSQLHLYRELMVGLFETVITEKSEYTKETPLEIYDRIKMEENLKITKETENYIRQRIKEDFKDYVHTNQGNN